MTSEPWVSRFLLAALLAGVAGCDGEGAVITGIEAELGATNAKSEANADVPPPAEGQTFYTTDGRDKRVGLENGMIVLLPTALNRCSTPVAAFGRALRDALLPAAAFAHGNHVDAPSGVIDVSSADGTRWHLGTVPVAPGEYCSVDVEFGRLPRSVPGGDAGAIVYIAPCWYPDSGTIPDSPGAPTQPDEVSHTCFQLPIAGATPAMTLELPAPVILDQSKRHVELTVRIEYDSWFNDVDGAALGCPLECAPDNLACTPCTDDQISAKPAEQEKLVANVAASIRLEVPVPP